MRHYFACSHETVITNHVPIFILLLKKEYLIKILRFLASGNSSPDSSEVHTATDVSLRSVVSEIKSVISEGSDVHTATDQTGNKKARRSVDSVASSLCTKSVTTAHDSSADEVSSRDVSMSSVRTESTLKSPTVPRSVVSGRLSVEDEKGSRFSFSSMIILINLRHQILQFYKYVVFSVTAVDL